MWERGGGDLARIHFARGHLGVTCSDISFRISSMLAGMEVRWMWYFWAYFKGLEIVCSRVNNQLRAVLQLGARGSFVSLLSSSHCSRAKARGNMDL